VVPVGPTAGGAASYSARAVQLRRGPRTARGLGWVLGRRRRLAEHAAQCLSCGVYYDSTTRLLGY
jgi:hypothetical protein